MAQILNKCYIVWNWLAPEPRATLSRVHTAQEAELYQKVNLEDFFMPYINEEGGRLNNFAAEPKMYRASTPNKNEQQKYIFLGIAALSLVGGLIAVAVSVSSIS